MLIAANVGFLAIQTVDKPDGVFSLPQRFSYLSLLFAQASVVMGLAIRSPRLFVSNHRITTGKQELLLMLKID